MVPVPADNSFPLQLLVMPEAWTKCKVDLSLPRRFVLSHACHRQLDCALAVAHTNGVLLAMLVTCSVQPSMLDIVCVA